MMEEILKYWDQILFIGAGIAYIVRLEMRIRANSIRDENNEKRITDIEGMLSPEKTNEWVAFKAVMEEKMKEARKDIKQLFLFHNKVGSGED